MDIIEIAAKIASTRMRHLDQLAREKALYLYLSTLERGDIEALEPILEQAENDLELDEMIFEAHEYLASEEG
jgi:hypothetical protein